MKDYLNDAILRLRPNSEFSYIGYDYSTIKWDVLEGKAPTQKEINIAIEEIKIEEQAEAIAKTEQRQAILDRLGLTADEAKLLLG